MKPSALRYIENGFVEIGFYCLFTVSRLIAAMVLAGENKKLTGLLFAMACSSLLFCNLIQSLAKL